MPNVSNFEIGEWFGFRKNKNWIGLNLCKRKVTLHLRNI